MVPISDDLVRWFDDLGLLPAVRKTATDRVLPYNVFCRGQDVHFSWVGFEYFSFCIAGVRGKVIVLADKHVHGHKGEADSQVLYHGLRLPSITARFESDFLLSSLDDALTVTWEAFGEDRPDSSPGGIVPSVSAVA